MASKEVAKVEDKNQVPAHLQRKTASLGNVDQTDLIIPRVKLLNAINPECEAFEFAKAGNFWHSLAEISMGDKVPVIPIVIRKSYQLWAPRGDKRGILARANDAVHWDTKEKFTVALKNVREPQIWDTTEGTVAGSGLDKFGSSVKDDPNSGPAAALTYNILWFLPDHPELGMVLGINTRSSVKPCKGLISKIDLRPVDHFGQRFIMGVSKEKNATGDEYYNYTYTADGYASESEYEQAKALFEKFGDADFRANDETLDEDAPKSEPGVVGGKKGKF